MALVRVVPLKDFLASALSTSFNGSAFSTDLPVSGQKLYGGLVLTTISTGRTFAGSIQSASSSGFGAVTTELQFALTSEVGSTWKAYATPSTDRPWRRCAATMSTAASTAGSWTGLLWAGIK